jgi:type IV fimbrial biogenesis protein FimT
MKVCLSVTTHRVSQRAFTLTEMMVTLVILCILAILAIPSLSRLAANTRMSTEASELLSMLHLTRSEAIKRNHRVTICKSRDGKHCSQEGDWSQGWIIYVDGAAIGMRDENDILLRVHGALSRSSTLTGNTHVADYISYLPNGQSKKANGAMQGGTLTLCSNTPAVPGRSIVITTGPGRPRLKAEHPDCS